MERVQGPKVENFLVELRNTAMVEQVWQYTVEELERITGKQAI